LRAESIPVTVDVTNDGSRKGEEVAQLHIHQRVGSAARPGRHFKVPSGFRSIRTRHAH